MPVCGADAIEPDDSVFAEAGRQRSVVAVPAGRRPLPFALLAIAVIALPSCGTSKDNDVARALTVQEFAFSPDPYRSEVGKKFTVVNLDAVDHTLTADDGSVATGAIKSRGRTSISIDRPGDTAFHCEIHSFMRGVIRVSAPSSRT
jgi:plastocyanin